MPGRSSRRAVIRCQQIEAPPRQLLDGGVAVRLELPQVVDKDTTRVPTLRPVFGQTPVGMHQEVPRKVAQPISERGGSTNRLEESLPRVGGTCWRGAR
jgi:hypothetical protein